jgi:arylsulfatase A-like enzyme
MKNHQPNLPAPEFIHKSISKTKYADSVVELDSRVGDLLKKLDLFGLGDNTIVFYTVDNGAWQDVYLDAGCTPFRSIKGTDREGGSRVPTTVRWPDHVKPGTKSDDIFGGLDIGR